MRYPELSSKELKAIELFVAMLDEAGWQEAKKWFEYFKTTTSESEFMVVDPPAFARTMTDHVIMELKYVVEDGWLKARKNDATYFHPENSDIELDTAASPRYLHFTIGKIDSQDHLKLRLVYRNLADLLEYIITIQDLVTFENFQQNFLQLMIPDCEAIYLEIGDYTVTEDGKVIKNPDFQLVPLWPNPDASNGPDQNVVML